MKKKSINLGCGNDGWGDVRLDLDPKCDPDVVANLEDLSIFDDQSFDDARSISVLEHIPNWRAALLEMLRITKKRLILEVPVNSDIRLTDPWRILFPSKNNIYLFFSIPQRARETLWQMDPWILQKIIKSNGFSCSVEMIFQFYAGVPSRCWRLTCWRNDV